MSAVATLPKTLEVVAFCSLIMGAGFFGTKYAVRPRYTLEINPERPYFPTESDKPKNPKAVILNYRQRHYPNIMEAQHKSLRCLEERGYAISGASSSNGWKFLRGSDTVRDRPVAIEQGVPEPLLRITRIKSEEEFDIDDFLKTCKECHAHTEVHRTTRPGPFSMSANKYVDRHEWAACYNDRKELF